MEAPAELLKLFGVFERGNDDVAGAEAMFERVFGAGGFSGLGTGAGGFGRVAAVGLNLSVSWHCKHLFFDFRVPVRSRGRRCLSWISCFESAERAGKSVVTVVTGFLEAG